MRSVMQHSFSQVPSVSIPRSKFNRSHGYKTTLDGGKLVPIFLDEVLPGDTHKLNAAAFARMNTPIVPIMDNLKMTFFYFFVPYRLLWDNWEKFCGAQDNPGDSIDFQLPTIDVTGETVGSLTDYFGLPLDGSTNALEVVSLPYRAYNLIYNEWFRDQNLVDGLTVDTGNGPDSISNYVIKNRLKRFDYFTSALTAPQKGDAVALPLGTTAPLNTTGNAVPDFTINGETGQLKTSSTSASNNNIISDWSDPVVSGNIAWSDPKLEVDLTSATAATINALRQAFQVQRLLERDARGGTRYVEILKSHFKVVSPDFRLQRPEFLGTKTVDVHVNPVAQTGESGTTPQGNLAAYATAAGTGIGFSHSFVEHGLIMGLVSIQADLTYQQGVEKMWSRSTRYDVAWPVLSHLGEQTILSKELFWQDVGSNNDDVFGYQERYAEYRYKPSRITGLFRSDVSGSIDVWHLSQDFASAPTLNETFITDNPPIDRVVATPDEPHFILDMYNHYISARPLPVYGVPGFTDHF